MMKQLKSFLTFIFFLLIGQSGLVSFLDGAAISKTISFVRKGFWGGVSSPRLRDNDDDKILTNIQVRGEIVFQNLIAEAIDDAVVKNRGFWIKKLRSELLGQEVKELVALFEKIAQRRPELKVNFQRLMFKDFKNDQKFADLKKDFDLTAAEWSSCFKQARDRNDKSDNSVDDEGFICVNFLDQLISLVNEQQASKIIELGLVETKSKKRKKEKDKKNNKKKQKLPPKHDELALGLTEPSKEEKLEEEEKKKDNHGVRLAEEEKEKAVSSTKSMQELLFKLQESLGILKAEVKNLAEGLSNVTVKLAALSGGLHNLSSELVKD